MKCRSALLDGRPAGSVTVARVGAVEPSTADRRLAALAHLGVPLYSVLLPLVVWATSGTKPFRRAHARQAFSFQCLFLVVWLIAVGLMLFGVLGPLMLVAVLAVGLVLEFAQVVVAMAGRPP